MIPHQPESNATSGPRGPGQSGISAAAPSRLNRLLVMLGVLLAGVIVSRLWRPRTSDPASALRATFADQSLLRGGSTPPQSPVAESIPTLDGPPDPDDASKPESPTDLSKPSILYVLRRTAREFSTDQCTDLAAALTYYAVLSLFPALVVVVSLLGVFGQGQRTTDAVLQIVGQLGPASAVDTLRTPIQQLVESPSAGFALIVGVLGAVWSASGYVGAFSRAMNRIYEVAEGRPVWKLRPIQLLLTLVGLTLAAAVALMLAVSGPIASAIGGAIDLGEVAETLWNIARWPVVLIFVTLTVATLYYAAPNVKQPKFRWISVGAGVAILVWILASVLFGFYVANFRQLQQDLRRAGRGHCVPALALDHQPGSALRCRTGRRTRAWTPTTGRHRRRTRSATAPSRQPGQREKPGQRRTRRRTRPRATAIRRSANNPLTFGTHRDASCAAGPGGASAPHPVRT